jgi:hypothetical protein
LTELKPRYNRIPEPRLLEAHEIKVRWSRGSEKGSAWLLYRTARTDIGILNETYGRENWQRLHKEAHDGTAYCGVAIWCYEKKCWVEKWDAGSESQIDPDKGKASSSFKRADTSWNIGIELYTDLFIWIAAKDIPVKQNKNNKWEKDSYSDPVVSYVEYNDKREIVKMAIDFENETVFKFPRAAKIPSDKPGKVTPPPKDLADDVDEEESTGTPDVHPGNPNELPRKKISDVTEPGIIKLLKVVAKKDFDPTAEFEFTTVRWLMPKEYDWLIGRDDYEDLQLVFDHFINTDGLGIGKEKKAELEKKLEELKPTESGEESSNDDEELDDLPF